MPFSVRAAAGKVFTNLSFWVLIAIFAGVLLGVFEPERAKQTEGLGKSFIWLVKLFIGPIVFLTIVLGIAGVGDLKKVGRIGLKALLYFEAVTTFALLLGLGVAYLLQPGHIGKGGLVAGDASKYTRQAGQPFAWSSFLKNNYTLLVLALAIACGIILSFCRRREAILSRLQLASGYVFKALRLVMYLAPLGAFAGIASVIGKYGLYTLVPLGKLVGSVYLTMLLFILLVLGGIMRFYGQSMLQLLKTLREELLLVLGTSSSEAALPSLMQKLERMGCSRPVVRLVVPSGYSFNLDGTSIYLSMAVVFLAQLYRVPLSPGELLSIIGILLLTSKGAAGVTGSGFVVLTTTLTGMGNKIPLEGLAFLLGVDKFLSEARAIANFVGNGVAAIVIAKSEEKRGKGEAADV